MALFDTIMESYGINYNEYITEGLFGFKIDRRKLKDPEYCKSIIEKIDNTSKWEYAGRTVSALVSLFIPPIFALLAGSLVLSEVQCMLGCKIINKFRVLGLSKNEDFTQVYDCAIRYRAAMAKSRKKAKTKQEKQEYDNYIRDMSKSIKALTDSIVDKYKKLERSGDITPEQLKLLHTLQGIQQKENDLNKQMNNVSQQMMNDMLMQQIEDQMLQQQQMMNDMILQQQMVDQQNIDMMNQQQTINQMNQMNTPGMF